MCSGSSAYNRKLSHLISKIIRPIWQEEESISTNTEEVMAAVHDINKENIETELLVGSADVRALYPSLDINHTAEIVAQTFYESKYEMEETDSKEIGLYLAINMTTEEIEKEKLTKYCPKRRSKYGAPPVITGCAIDNNPTNRHRPWTPPKDTALSRKN